MKLVVLAYKPTSKGAKMVASTLGVAMLTLADRFNANDSTACLNWGRGDYPEWRNEIVRFINPPEACMRAIDKLKAFSHMKRGKAPCVPFTMDKDEAKEWVRAGHIVMCRTETQGFNGSGIVIARTVDQVVSAPLYTRYIKKDAEYRVHVMNGSCFYSNIKRKKREVPEGADPLVRSGSHGWYFEHMDRLPSQVVQDACVAAVEALGLDFGGVDVVEEKGTGAAYVLEVNTAPEMGVNTMAAYKKALKQNYGQYKNNENVPIRNL